MRSLMVISAGERRQFVTSGSEANSASGMISESGMVPRTDSVVVVKGWVAVGVGVVCVGLVEDGSRGGGSRRVGSCGVGVLSFEVELCWVAGGDGGGAALSRAVWSAEAQAMLEGSSTNWVISDSMAASCSSSLREGGAGFAVLPDGRPRLRFGSGLSFVVDGDGDGEVEARSKDGCSSDKRCADFSSRAGSIGTGGGGIL